MARPVTISEERILNAAREVFLRDGVGAPTAAIARHAGVAEGTLFRRFPTKEALFRAAVQAPPIPAWVRNLDSLAGVGDLHRNLIDMAHEILALAQQLLPLSMMAWGSKTLPDTSRTSAADSPILRDRRLLARFLRGEMDRGRLRPGDPEVLARLLFDPCLGLVMDHLVLQEPLSPAAAEVFIEALVAGLWDGFGPDPDTETPGHAARGTGASPVAAAEKGPLQ